MAFKDHISREEMGALVAKGEGVLWQGRVITNQADLPTKMDLAGDNEEDQAIAQKEMEAEIKRQQAQLEASKKAADEAKAEKEKQAAAADSKYKTPAGAQK
jgi:hypothetical protein